MEKPAQCPAASSTTFVCADATTFKDLVQRLTGLPEPRRHLTWPPPPPSSSSATKLSGLKRLHERHRQGRPPLRLAIPRTASTPAAVNAALASPSAGFAELHINDVGENGEDDELNEEEEERAIKERRFYLHPSPQSRARAAEPALLPLFPVTSPKAQ